MDWSIIDACIQHKSLLKHPFYQAWSKGELTLSDLRIYAEQYYAVEALFPCLLSRIHSNCIDSNKYAQVRQHILENLNDEEYGDENHRELWLRFAEGLGLMRDNVVQAQPYPETLSCIHALQALAAHPHPVIGLSALYAYESQLPAISQSKIEGLVDYYGITDKRTLQFFETHKDIDQWHSAQEKKMISALNPDENDVLSAAEKSCAALWTFLDGVEKQRLVSGSLRN